MLFIIASSMTSCQCLVVKGKSIQSLAGLLVQLLPYSFFDLLSLGHNNTSTMTPPLKRTDSITAIIDHKQPTVKDRLAAAWNAIKEPFRRKRTHHLLKKLAKAQQSQ